MELLVGLSLAFGTLLGLVLAAKSADPGMYTHGLLFAALCLIGTFAMVKRHFDLAGRGIDRSATPEGYNDEIVRAGAIASVLWGLVGFAVGLVIALQLAFPILNFDLPWTSFDRLRPLHTSAVIFAFGGNVLIMTSFYVVQRTCHARLAGNFAPWFVFWGYQVFILLAATGWSV